MRKKIKRLILFAILGGITYALLTYHFIIYTGGENKTVKPLPKSTMTFSDTFISLETGEFGSLKNILKRGTLREDGLGDVLVELEIITEEKLRKMEEEIDAEE